MSVRVWGNQHGHGATLDGWDAALLQALAAKQGITPEEAFNRAIRDALDKKKENDA